MELMTVKEVAKYLKLTDLTIRRKVKTGELPYIKMGRSIRFEKSEIDAWVRGQK
jgi:excisionase family DNA binding protein